MERKIKTTISGAYRFEGLGFRRDGKENGNYVNVGYIGTMKGSIP